MKQLTLLFLFLFLGTTTAQSQSGWFDGNPQWVNLIYAGFSGQGSETCQIIGDTLLGGLPAKICRRYEVLDIGQAYIYNRIVAQTGDSIWGWYIDKYILLYNFAKVAGDTFTVIDYANNPVITYRIDSIGVMTINNTPLRFQKISQIPVGSNTPKTTIIEKIGALNFTRTLSGGNLQVIGTHFFMDEPNMLVVDGTDWNFCNYKNDAFGYAEPWNFCSSVPPLDTGCTADVPVMMVQAVECVLPQVIATGEILLPCEAPSGFYQLTAGTKILVKTSPHPGCTTICQQGTPVKIECFEFDVSGTKEETSLQQSISISPNPASDMLQYDHFDHGTISIVNVQGQTIFQTTANPDHQLDISQLPNGMFLITFANEKTVVVKKIIKAN